MMLAVTSVLLLSGLMAGCGDDTSDVVTVDQERGEELVVDWGEGLTYEEQVEEIKLVNEVMAKHFGEKVLPHVDGNPWDLETYLSQPGIPNSSSRAEDHFYFRINYDFSKVEPGDDVQQKGLAVLEELGLTPNGDLPTSYDSDRKSPLRVAGGKEDHGRLFMIRQMGSDAAISATFWTRHSDHESMRKVAEENLEGWEPSFED